MHAVAGVSKILRERLPLPAPGDSFRCDDKIGPALGLARCCVAKAIGWLDERDAAEFVFGTTLARLAGSQPIEGGRLTLKPFPTTATSRLATTVAVLCVAPWSRVYADLRLVGVLGEDAAEHLREIIRD